jgi:hypothetical protein
MYLEPKNRHLLVLPMEPEEEESVILLPEEYKKPRTPYIICDVLGISEDCNIDIDIGDTVVIEGSMLCEVKASGETNYLVLENYIYGRIKNE